MVTYKYLLFLFITIFLVSCSNGKIEYRKTANGCINFPKLSERVYADTSTTMESDKINDNKLEVLLKQKNQLQNESQEVYLINTAHSDVYSFTLKLTINDINQTSKTLVYKLNPGEEIKIGCNTNITETMELVKQKFEIVGEKKNR